MQQNGHITYSMHDELRKEVLTFQYSTCLLPEGCIVHALILCHGIRRGLFNCCHEESFRVDWRGVLLESSGAESSVSWILVVGEWETTQCCFCQGKDDYEL